MNFQSKSKMIGLSLIASIGLMTSAEAGIITTQPQADPSVAPGFNGWNYGNVDVFITDLDFNPVDGKTFDATDGSYTAMIVGDTFESQVKDDTGTIMGKVHGKNWPVGEPAGVKVINDDPGKLQNGKPENCIMTTSYLEGAYLDSAAPVYTTCSSDFQTHKRFKTNLQPSTIDGGTDSIDFVFNVADETGMRRYEVFQKINNYTGKRLVGYTTQVGFGIGTGFTPATTAHDLNISLGELENDTVEPAVDIWAVDERASFAHGLWGPVDKHFPVPGFFSDKSAGFLVTLDTDKKIATSGDTLDTLNPDNPGNYGTLFGNWLTNQWAPTGIFYDFDDDPTTDADLVAFWADVDGDGTYAWTDKGPDFNEIDPTVLAAWAMNRLYSVGKIEDVLNLGLNYIINVGDVKTFADYNVTGDETATFTIRITPKLADQSDPANTDIPGWITFPPVFGASGSLGTVTINPDPFTPGSPLTILVSDSDMNEDNASIETLDVNVTNDLGETELVQLTELTIASGVFRGVLNTNSTSVAGSDNDGILNVTEGSVVTATYHDADDGTGNTAVVTDTATAAAEPATSPTLGDNDSSKGVFSAVDDVSLIAMIVGFLAIGAFIARRRLAK